MLVRSEPQATDGCSLEQHLKTCSATHHVVAKRAGAVVTEFVFHCKKTCSPSHQKRCREKHTKQRRRKVLHFSCTLLTAPSGVSSSLDTAPLPPPPLIPPSPSNNTGGPVRSAVRPDSTEMTCAMACAEGGSIARERNSPMRPSLSDLIRSATDSSGHRSISGSCCSGISSSSCRRKRWYAYLCEDVRAACTKSHS